ncbi:MAG: ATP-binding cassette domain-containing protein [Propionibacteriaceae bacterium]|nr:ATP-binding cassette domain-containing protein [Propionibacteriaceae bacterium]
MNQDIPAVQIAGLHKSFGDNHVLRGLDLAVPQGVVYALLGANGAGKTTTISILTTLQKPDSGRALVAGFDVVKQAAQVRQAITVTGQSVCVDTILTGKENLVLIARLRHVKHPGALADELLERFNLADAAAKPVGTYSGGMKRRLDIAMSLIGDPQVVFLDEPTTGLDPSGRREVWAAIKDLATQGRTIMLTTQYMDEATQLADLIGVLIDGVIAVEGDHQAILDAAGSPDLESAFLQLTEGDAK